MALYKILHFPNPNLRIVGEPITEFNDELQKLVDDMFETMYAANGVGLAGSQIDVHKQIAVIDVSNEKNQPMVIINPTIIETKNPVKMEEGCLSVPGVYDALMRSDWVKVKALDRFGKEFEIEATGLLAECLQHEIDHLNGKLYIDHLTPMRRERIHKKLDKKRREM